MPEVNLVVVYNNQKQLEEMYKSIPVEYGIDDRCFLNNTKRAFSSAAAYNYALKQKVDGDIIIFCHQDIRFSENSISRIIEACTKEPNTVFGVAGVKNLGKDNWGQTISTLKGGKMNWDDSILNSHYESVFVLDECLIAGNRELFDKVSFDEKTCDGWHLYVADLCIQCHLNGLDVKVMDAEVQHLSPGHVDKSFIRCEGKLAKKYRKNYGIITHTNGWTYTGRIKRVVVQLYRYFKYRWWNI